MLDGLSAYEIAVSRGYRGSELDWLRSLRGKDGTAGPMGKEGPQGQRGMRGETGPAGAIGERGPMGLVGKAGVDGRNGWTPIIAIVEDGERRVQQVVRWAGGTGPEPETGWYVGPNGPVTDIRNAVDLRGSKGDSTQAILAGGIIQVYSEDYDPSVSYVALNFQPESPGVYTLRLNIP